MTIQLARAVHFSCAHSYKVKEWSKEQNLAEFGACFSPSGHGHSYRLECFIEGKPDPVTGMIINLRDLDLLLKKAASELDGKFLDKEVEAFLNTVPTTEKIGEYLFAKIKSELHDSSLKITKVRLFETDDLWIEITP